MARTYSSTKEYVTGDIAIYNKTIFVSKTCHINKNPVIETSDWDNKKVDVIPGQSGFSKHCVVRDRQIIKGKEHFTSVTVGVINTAAKFKFEFSQLAPNANYIVLCSYMNLNTYEKFSFGIDPDTKNETGFDVLVTNNEFFYQNVQGGAVIPDYSDLPYEISIHIKEV